MAKLTLALGLLLINFVSVSGDLDEMFELYVSKYNRIYSSADEKMKRFEVFKENMHFIQGTNSKQSSYKLGWTPFTDMSSEEFRSYYLPGFIASTVENTTVFRMEQSSHVLEDSIDWTTKGAVSPVKNQGQCGSCWTFSTTGALEGAMVVAGREMVQLSEQELVSCDTGLMGGHGCNGGNPLQAMGWVKKNGICSETSEPYVCMDMNSDECTQHSCAESSCTPVLKAGGWFTSGDVTAASSVGTEESDLEAAVSRQPISVAIEADQPVFQHYTGGVLSDTACGQNLDHAVLAVGYGVDNGQKYWKIKNSWSSAWGEDGYIRIARGLADGYGECGIRHMASFPTVKSADAYQV